VDLGQRPLKGATVAAKQQKRENGSIDPITIDIDTSPVRIQTQNHRDLRRMDTHQKPLSQAITS
jgi:hypothetical protein